MSLNTRVDTYQIEFGEHGILQVETTYNFEKDNTVVIRVKQNNDDGFFNNTGSMSGSLIYSLIDMLETAAEQLDKLEKASD